VAEFISAFGGGDDVGGHKTRPYGQTELISCDPLHFKKLRSESNRPSVAVL
jgi:hypothetical protein